MTTVLQLELAAFSQIADPRMFIITFHGKCFVRALLVTATRIMIITVMMVQVSNFDFS
jgi:hypothetical protein